MKILTLSAVFGAMLALTRAVALLNDQVELGTGETIPEGQSHAVKRSTSCPWGWSRYRGRCFKYVPTPMTWTRAEQNCLSMHANLASVHSSNEYHAIQQLIVGITHAYDITWIGGYKAHGGRSWLWSDGTSMRYFNWCPKEPNNLGLNQRCIQMNFSGKIHQFIHLEKLIGITEF
uniref:C-type lectin domain-containing protein n=1 Tax=Monopterus albus TaxID=43700 RepID=A0A3Q3IJR7_MONAL